MLRLQRKLLRDTLLLGVTMTLAVIAIDNVNGLAPFERIAYDRRAQLCQFFTPPPTDKLVHLDIDDHAMDVIGKWPWSRALLAEMVDEIAIAKPKVFATDVLFESEEDWRAKPLSEDSDATPGLVAAVVGKSSTATPSTTPSSTHPSTQSAGALPTGTRVKLITDQDEQFARSLRRIGCALVPAQLIGTETEEFARPIQRAMYQALFANLDVSEEQMADALQARGFGAADVTSALTTDFFAVRRRAVADRMADLLDQPRDGGGPAARLSLPAVTAALLTPAVADAPVAYNSPLTHVITEQYPKVLAAVAMRRMAMALPPHSAPVLTVPQIADPPLAIFLDAAMTTGFVDHQFSGEPVVRSVPLLIGHKSDVYPQLGLSLAFRMLDVDTRMVRFDGERLTLPLPGGKPPIIIPVRTIRSGVGREVPAVMYVPWFGAAEWQTMYDWPKHRQLRQHVSLTEVWDILQTRRKLREDNANCDKAIRSIWDENPANQVIFRLGLDPAKAKRYFDQLPDMEDAAARQQIAAACLKDLNGFGILDSFADLAAKGTISDEERSQWAILKDAKQALEVTSSQSAALQRQLVALRHKLSTEFGGKAVLVGWAASASQADFISTSLHDRAPGVLVHGAVFNAIMTRHFWRAAPLWVNILCTLLCGMLAAVAAATLSPTRAMGTAALILAAYLVVNGVLLFDRMGLIVGVAGPVAATVFVWAACVLLRTIVESRERALVTRRFQNYVDPSLVNFVLEHPERIRFDGEVKELTVLFTDLAGFTSISERLGERSVTLLNDYMAAMVPIVRRHNGYRNKFLGDGIMCFYGAPADNPDHAVDAVATALAMNQEMAAFNRRMAEQGMPPLKVRAGISTGRMVVGDAGSPDASDYTVLGDAVNFGSRLEGANKYVGTQVLVSGRTAELSRDRFLFRPVGKLRVVGKSEEVDVVEAICLADDATADQQLVAEQTATMVRAYQAGDFQTSLNAADVLDNQPAGPTRLTAIYRERANHYLVEGKPDDFDGTITLEEK